MEEGGGLEGGLFCMSSAIDVAGETACSVFMKDEKLGDYGKVLQLGIGILGRERMMHMTDNSLLRSSMSVGLRANTISSYFSRYNFA